MWSSSENDGQDFLTPVAAYYGVNGGIQLFNGIAPIVNYGHGSHNTCTLVKFVLSIVQLYILHYVLTTSGFCWDSGSVYTVLFQFHPIGPFMFSIQT